MYNTVYMFPTQYLKDVDNHYGAIIVWEETSYKNSNGLSSNQQYVITKVDWLWQYWFIMCKNGQIVVNMWL